jgi:hypothetical protein
LLPAVVEDQAVFRLRQVEQCVVGA